MAQKYGFQPHGSGTYDVILLRDITEWNPTITVTFGTEQKWPECWGDPISD